MLDACEAAKKVEQRIKDYYAQMGLEIDKEKMEELGQLAIVCYMDGYINGLETCTTILGTKNEND